MGLTLVAVAVALAGAGWSLSNLFREHVTEQFEAQLMLHLDQLTAAFEVGENGVPRLSAPLSDPRWNRPYSGLYWQIERARASEGTASAPVLRSRSLWDARLRLPVDDLAFGDLHHHRIDGPGGQSLRALERQVRFVAAVAPTAAPAASSSAPTWRLVVAADDAALEEAVARFAGLLVLFLGILGLALLAAAWAQVHLGLRPLRELQGAVQAVRTGRARRIDGSFPTEVQPLVQDFNRVLEQNHEVVRRARELAGNLAHAVRTPLAIIGDLSDDTRIDRADLSRDLREQVARVRDQVDRHLSRARRAGAGLPGQRTEVRPILEGLVRVMDKVHALREGRSGLEIELVQVDPGLHFAGEAQDLQEMAGNLLDNACKWAHSRVRIRAARADHAVCIAIDDDGPGLAGAQHEAVFERGVRADERTPGSGLGLAIARETADLYGGTITLGPSEMGGLSAELRLPAFLEDEGPRA